MNAQDVIVPFTSLFIVGMIWLRTRMQYSRSGVGPLRLQPAGRIYFAAAIAVLAVGWFIAPALGRALWPTTGATPTLMRVVWCLATYYIFIVVHRVLKVRGTVVFRPGGGAT
jgi:hypothetical protein